MKKREEPTKLLANAQEHLDNYEYAQAEALAVEALSLSNVKADLTDDDEAVACCILGECCVRFARHTEAWAHFARALAAAERASNLSLQSRAMCGTAMVQNPPDGNETTLGYLEKALALAEKAGDKLGQSNARNRFGVLHKGHGDYPRALESYSSALAFAEEIGHKSGVAGNLCNIAHVYSIIAEYPHSLDYFTRALAVIDVIDHKEFKTNALVGMGIVYLHLADYPSAMNCLTGSLAISEQIGKRGLAAWNLGQIGGMYLSLADYPNALEYLTRALALAEEIGDKEVIATSLDNIGLLHSSLSDYPRALEYYTRALTFREEVGEEMSIAGTLNNIGDVHSHLSDYASALEFYEQARECSVRSGSRRQVGFSTRCIAAVEHKLGNLETAMHGYLETLHHQREVLKSNELVASTLLDVGRVLIEQGKTEEGLTRLVEALSLAEELGEKKTEAKAHKELAEVYGKKGNMQNAFEHFQKHYALEKEIFSDESRKKVAQFNMRVAIAEKEKEADRERHEKEVEKMKRELLERELSNTTLQFLAQTESISNFRNDMLQTLRKLPPTEPVAKELREKLKALPAKSVDWKKFDAQFKSAHPEFTTKLLDKHPSLTRTELRICSLLRMNLRSAEIAQLLSLSERTIEHHRAHIRTKMKLKNSEDLIKLLAAM